MKINQFDDTTPLGIGASSIEPSNADEKPIDRSEQFQMITEPETQTEDDEIIKQHKIALLTAQINNWFINSTVLDVLLIAFNIMILLSDKVLQLNFLLGLIVSICNWSALISGYLIFKYNKESLTNAVQGKDDNSTLLQVCDYMLGINTLIITSIIIYNKIF